MGATGYIIHRNNIGSNEPEKTYNVVPADGTIAVERTEVENEVTFAIKTTYDGYETINVASHTVAGYVRAIRVKFTASNQRYRLVCILNGASDSTVVKDFAIYYIKMGYDIGGLNYEYIQEYSRIGNGSYVVLEKISTSEYNILMYMPRSYAAANIGVLKEDKEPNVTIKHYDGNVSIHHPEGTIINPDVPTWRNGAPAVWQIIPDVVNPVAGMLGHYYNLDKNLYFYDGYNWNLVYALAQGVASMLATTDAPATANEGTIYYDTTEQNLKIWINGGWKTIINESPSTFVACHPHELETNTNGVLRLGFISSGNTTLQVYWNGWKYISATNALMISVSSSVVTSPVTGRIYFNTTDKKIWIYSSDGVWYDAFGNTTGTGPTTIAQVITFTDYSGETIAANDTAKIIVMAAFGAVSILDLTAIEKQEGKTIEITNISGNTFKVKDGASVIDLNGGNESVIKAICLSSTWHYYKVGTITEFT